MEKWEQTEDLKVKRGDLVLEIGDKIAYHDRLGKDGKDLYKGKWQILGVDEEGRLLIVSKDNVATWCYSKKMLKGGIKAYSKGIKQLEKICKKYSKSTGSVKARCIRIEDVDKLTKYDKFDVAEEKVYCNKAGETFLWHDGKRWKQSKREKKITLKNTFYWYKASELQENKKVYDMLFGRNKEKNYWLASRYVVTYSDYAAFGFRSIYGGFVRGSDFVSSTGDFMRYNRGVRVVITLKTDVKIMAENYCY